MSVKNLGCGLGTSGKGQIQVKRKTSFCNIVSWPGSGLHEEDLVRVHVKWVLEALSRQTCSFMEGYPWPPLLFIQLNFTAALSMPSPVLSAKIKRGI